MYVIICMFVHVIFHRFTPHMKNHILMCMYHGKVYTMAISHVLPDTNISKPNKFRDITSCVTGKHIHSLQKLASGLIAPLIHNMSLPRVLNLQAIYPL